jgi:hypothetical protein
MIIHSPIVSGSLTFANGATFTLPTGGVYSGSFSGSYQGVSFTGGTFSGNGSGLTFGGTGIVSGSSQLTTDFDARYLNTDGDGIVSSSAQVITLLPTGTISGSSQVDADSVTNFDANVLTYNNTLGVISGSSQVNADSITNFDANVLTYNNSLAVVSGSASSVKTFLSLGNVTNESKATMFTSPEFTGTPIAPTPSSNDSSTKIATTAYVQQELTDLIGGASAAFDTLLEISASLASGDSGLTTLVDGKLSKSSNLSDLTDVSSARTNLGLASTSNVQFNSLGIGMAASATAGRIDATNDIVAYSSSDRRFKENITPITNPLEKISKISGNTYDWKEENKIEHGYEGNDVGVIAQEIEEVLPQLVQTRENGYKAVKYDKLVALLIEGIKEQQSQIEELRNKIEKLENGL